jgi:hypothetical protein
MPNPKYEILGVTQCIEMGHRLELTAGSLCSTIEINLSMISLFEHPICGILRATHSGL